MAIFKSDGYLKNIRLRPDSQVEPAEATFTITVPDGKGVADNDLFYFCKVGENVDILSVDLTVGVLDSNASAAVAGAMGTVPSTTAKTSTAVEAVTGYNSIFTATVLNINSGVAKNIQRFAGGGTGDIFNINPFPVSSVVSDLVLVLSASPGTAVTSGDKHITARVKYQYAYPSRVISGVTDSEYPLSGTISYSQPQTYDYNGNAP